MTDLAAPPLVDVGWLARHLDHPDVVPVEVGRDATTYYTSHLPGAVVLDWLDDLQEPVRRGFVTQARFEALLTEKGIGRDDHVVLYGDAENCFAAHAYWIFRYYGHSGLSLLDGGRPAWVRAGQPMEESVRARPAPVPPYRSPGPRPDIRATREDIVGRFAGSPPGVALIDCRSPVEYSGVAEHPLDLPLERHRVVGHVPGAVNLPTDDLVDPFGALRPVEELRRLFEDRGATPDVEVALYCRLAERSSLLWFVLHDVLGHPRVRNYDGGWAEYGSLVDVPVSR